MKRLFFLMIVVAFSCLAEEAVQTESFTIKVTGQKTWGLRTGFGDASLLALEGLEAGGPILTQSLWAQVEGTVMDFLTIRASFNDQLGPGFQDFLVIVDRQPWYAELGKFTVGGEGDALGVYNKRVLGARVSLAREGLALSGLLARLEGISESLTFQGQLAQAERTFSYEDPQQPWLPAPYNLSVEGLWFFLLRLPFVEGFSQPELRFQTGQDFTRFLHDWGLEYLAELVDEEPSWDLPSGAYRVLRDEGDVLLFRREPKVVLRDRVLDLLDLYNASHGLTGEGKKSYPFVLDSDLEDSFLTELAGFTALVVDGETYPLSSAQRRRYLDLGEGDIREESFSLTVRLPGEEAFRSLDDPALADFSYKLFAPEGILRLDFPPDFFRSGAAIHVQFEYASTSGVYYLGPSIIPGSERVYLNDVLLSRNTDYAIDYELGVLTLFRALGAQDVLRVDFERQRGALGVSTEYERYFLGAALELGAAKIGVYQAADVGSPTPTSRLMPNTHSIIGLSWQGEIGGWQCSAQLGFSENVFPSDLGERIPGRNRVKAIVSARTAEGEALVFAHQNGITVYQNGRFEGYGSAQGLAGQAALALLALPGRLLIGTDSGLTLVDLSEPGALGKVRSWTRIYSRDWNENRTEEIRGTKILALAQDGERVFMASEAEVLIADFADITKPENWQRLEIPAGEPRALLWAGDLLLGTSAGLFKLTSTGWERLLVGEVFDVLARPAELFVATNEGVRILRNGEGAGWLSFGEPVRALAYWQGSIWYATESGVFREGELVLAGDFTALGVGSSALWAGTKADENFQLDLWRVDPNPQRFPQTQTKIDGRDLTNFSDPPREGHVRLGPSATLSFSRKFGDWEWQVGVYSRFPGYEEIGQGNRTDAHGLSFFGRYAQGNLSLSLRSRADLADLTTAPVLRLAAGLEGTWNGPWIFSFSLNPTFSGAKDRSASLSADYRLGLSAEGNPNWSLSGSGKISLPEWYLAGDLTGKISYSPWPGLALDLSWVRPYRSRGAQGTETLVLSARLNGGEGFSWSLAWEEKLWHPLGRSLWDQSRTISGEIRPPAWTFALGKAAPRITGALEMDPAEMRAQGNVFLNADLSSHLLQVSFGLDREFRFATERLSTGVSLSASWNYTGWKGVRPSLSYKHAWKILTHPRYTPQVSESKTLEGRVVWDLPGGNRNELSLSWSTEGNLELRDRLTWRTPFGPVQLESALSWSEDGIRGKVRAEGGLNLASQWGLNIEGGILFGGSPLRLAGFLGATLIANF